MSEAPERIWAWWDDTYDTGLVNTHGDKRYTPDDAREYVRAARIDDLKAKLAKAVEALEEAIYLLDPEEEDIAKETGIYRVVTTCKELKGEDQ